MGWGVQPNRVSKAVSISSKGPFHSRHDGTCSSFPKWIMENKKSVSAKWPLKMIGLVMCARLWILARGCRVDVCVCVWGEGVCECAKKNTSVHLSSNFDHFLSNPGKLSVRVRQFQIFSFSNEKRNEKKKRGPGHLYTGALLASCFCFFASLLSLFSSFPFSFLYNILFFLFYTCVVLYHLADLTVFGGIRTAGRTDGVP